MIPRRGQRGLAIFSHHHIETLVHQGLAEEPQEAGFVLGNEDTRLPLVFAIYQLRYGISTSRNKAWSRIRIHSF